MSDILKNENNLNYTHSSEKILHTSSEMFNKICASVDLEDDIETKKEKIIDYVYSIYKKFPTSKNFMERTVREHADEEFKDKNGDLIDSVRLTIVKQFVKNTNYGAIAVVKDVISKHQNEFDASNISEKDTAKKRNFALSRITESIFDNKNLSDDNWCLLKLADDLANSKFRVENRTKEDLYLFACAFKMTYAKDKQNYNGFRDISKNLFEDYYNNNFLRYIRYFNDDIDEEKDLKKLNCGIEKEPSGSGINYKNFVEMIYVYCIYQYSSAKKRITVAGKLIEECKKSVKKAEYKIGKGNNKNDIYFKKGNASSEDYTFDFKCGFHDVIDLDRDRFCEYIKTQYDIAFGISINTLNKEQKTAYENYTKILNKIEGTYESNDIINYFDKFIKNDNDFYRIIEKIFEYISEYDDVNADNISRTRIIAAYYQLFMKKYSKWDLCDGLESLFDNFSNSSDAGFCLNNVLEESRYQKMSPKNLFDFLIVVFIYFDKVLPLKTIGY